MKQTFPSPEKYLAEVADKIEREVRAYDHGKINRTEILIKINDQISRAYNRGICIGVTGQEENAPD